jgi:hypothetical protein
MTIFLTIHTLFNCGHWFMHSEWYGCSQGSATNDLPSSNSTRQITQLNEFELLGYDSTKQIASLGTRRNKMVSVLFHVGILLVLCPVKKLNV